MYYRYFGLTEEPFSIAVNPRYLFMSARHRDALAHLLYGVGAGGGFILLTGEVGTGKTTINRCLLQQLPAAADIAIILNPALNAEELLATACDELGIDYEADKSTLKDLTDRLHAFLLDNHGKGRNTVLLIDEAQHLQFDVLEQIRLLTNLETNTRKLLQIILVGQPELGAMLARPELRQLSQRITARYNLEPLNLEETDAYIRHRLQVAGLPANRELFPPALVRAVYRHSGGIPRLINLLCDRSLLGAYGQNRSRVDRAVLKQAVVEVMGTEQRGRDKVASRYWVLAAAAVIFALFLLVPGWQQTVSGIADMTAIEPAPVVSAPSTIERPASQAWTGEAEAALALLADYLGVPRFGADTCVAIAGQGWRCESLRARSWNELLEFDRPAVLGLLTPERFRAFAVLVALDEEQAILLTDTGREVVSLRQLAPMWSGEFQLLWRPPAGFERPFGMGYRGPVVAWLAQRFAYLDGQSEPLAGITFNQILDTRVRLFQRSRGLRDDGVVGMKTLLKLEATVDDKTLRLDHPGLSTAGEQ